MCKTRRADLLTNPRTQPVQHPVQSDLVTAPSRPGQKTVPEYDLHKKSGGRDQRDKRRKDGKDLKEGKDEVPEHPRTTAQSARVSVHLVDNSRTSA